jgi:hypothetical protein
MGDTSMMSKEKKATMSMHRMSRISHGSARSALRLALAVAAAVLAFAVLPAAALANQPILDYSLESSDQVAGGHPDLRASFELEGAGEPEIARDIEVKLPQGVFGNPGAILRCTAAEFALNHCDPGMQAGIVTIYANYEGDPKYVLGTAPVYNMQRTSEDEAARLAFVAPTVNVPIVIPVSVRSGSDYGLTLNIQGIPQSVPLAKSVFEVWGFPADPVHDESRFPAGEPNSPSTCPGITTTGCIAAPFPSAGGALVYPYLSNPTVCTGAPLHVSMSVTTYQDPTNPTTEEAEYPETTECVHERFDPVLKAGLTTDEADAPSGLNLQLSADQFLEKTVSPSQLRAAVVTLPEGLSINPDAADGQSSCTDAEANFGTDSAGHCPDNSKIGTFDVESPAIEGPLVGSLYIGEPQPHNQYRLFMIADGFGVHVKLIASVVPDPATGRLTISVHDLPQVPFKEFNLHLFASDRGLMATPTRCTLYQVDSVFTPWNGLLSPQHSRPTMSVSRGPGGSECPGQLRPFNPSLVAGTSNPLAGKFSDFHLRLDREDGDQFLGDLNFRMPPGFTGSLRGIPYCPDANIAAAAQRLGREELASPSCPVASQVGTSNVAAGPGHHPFHAVGKMYLAGPFKGAPLSLVAVTPALAGPYDYGVVVVRVALHVDPLTAQVSAVSDTVPSIIGGIPIRMRSIQVNIDRPHFTINPTNCSPFSVDSQGIGDQGTVANFSSYFQSLNCETLPFKPRMTIKQLGKRKYTRRAHDPVLQFDLWTRPGDANIKSVSVTLPKVFEVDQRHLGNICSKAELEATHCAGRQPIGTVMTKTPLLDQPLSGPAYAVSGYGRLPHLAFILAGQVTLIPQAESSSVKHGHLKTVAPVVPDAPIGHFRLRLLGGKKGYITNTRNLCAGRAISTVVFNGQNGKRRKQRVVAKTRCGHTARRKKHHR